MYLRTKPIAPFGEFLRCLRCLRPLRYNRYIYYVEGFSVNIFLLEKVVSRRLGRPGPQIGDLVEWGMANQNDRRAPALRDDTWIIKLHAYALVDPTLRPLTRHRPARSKR